MGRGNVEQGWLSRSFQASLRKLLVGLMGESLYCVGFILGNLESICFWGLLRNNAECL